MKTYYIILIALLLGLASQNFAQQPKFRSGIFLHHSTGGCIWGPNGSNTSVPNEMTKYNSSHGFTGEDAVSMTEEWWPNADNEWSTWHRIFANDDENNDIRSFLQNNRIVVIKSCFPSSNISAVGSPADTLDPDRKTIFNYKWHWKSIIRIMESYRENFFVIWTNAPLVANDTNDEEAYRSHQFCRWAKDTLATGNDPSFGSFPPNVYVFDFFHKLVDSSYKLPLQYAADAWDSHPNAAATELVAPQFVNEIFDAAIAYETGSRVIPAPATFPRKFRLEQNYPNPFNSMTVIRYQLAATGFVSLKIFNTKGSWVKTLVQQIQKAGHYAISWDGKNRRGYLLPSGLYFLELTVDNSRQTRSAIILR